MEEKTNLDFIGGKIETIPGSEHLISTHSQMERELEATLPKTYPISVWMITYWPHNFPRHELVLPENPTEEAS